MNKKWTFLPRSVGGVITKQNIEWGNINISPVFRANGKRAADFCKTKKFKSLLNLAQLSGVTLPRLLVVKTGGKSDMQGTWLHPELVCIMLTRGGRPKWFTDGMTSDLRLFAEDWLSGGLKSLEQKPEPDLFETVLKKQSEDTRMKEAMTAMMLPSPKLLKRMLVSMPDRPPESAPANNLQDTIDKLRKQLEAYRTILSGGGWFTMNQMAKMIGAKDYGSTNLAKYLIEEKVIYREKGRLIPYQSYVNKGWMKAFTGRFTVEKHNEIRNYPVTRYTLKGVLAIFEMLKGSGKIPKDSKYDLNAGVEETEAAT